ncbi:MULTISPECIES: DUF4190 domain-containing protein [unclassified Frigoribacterium]|uniref:DUF4190 domain-containing protein n=1 Tax=unclassified Frigoribacterium TaxID=2627005 RepID=UPI000F46C4C9|nr:MULTISPECIES: DUF4190 domain-containing protein [unclassified Frigoribacterium]ROS54023.1 hypothetical protein EDF21_1881 [Frigoribacterium sp. PhB118]WAC52130.1 hypothetical protein OVA02_02275 [Frigoribacterium sp. SL97]
MSNEQPGRPPSPWARFARPAPTEPDRGEFPFGPPRPVHPEAGVADRGWPLDPSGAPSMPATRQQQPFFPQPAASQPPSSQPVGQQAAGQQPVAQQAAAPTWDSDGRQVWAPPPGPVPETGSAPDARPENAGLGSYFFPADDDWSSAPPRTDDEGRGLAIASIVFGVFFAPLGLVFGIVAARRARAAGRPATLALTGMVVASIVIVLSLVYAIAALDYYSQLATTCAQLGPGDYVNGDGRTVTCG